MIKLISCIILSYTHISIYLLIFTYIIKEIRILNEEGEIKSIAELKTVNKEVYDTYKGEYFLDYYNGDLYTFKHYSRKWVYALNIGLINSKLRITDESK